MFNPTPIRPHKVLLFNEISQTNFSTGSIRLHHIPFSISSILLHRVLFTAGQSCLSNLLLLSSEGTVTQLMGDHNNANVVNLDFARSVDSVNYRLLLASLSHLIWVKIRAMDQILLDGKNSQGAADRCIATDDEDQKWGTSRTRPLLFLMLIDDLAHIINVQPLLFANDVKLVSPHSQSDSLQSSLNNAWKWSLHWGLPIGPTKCNYIAFVQAPPH